MKLFDRRLVAASALLLCSCGDGRAEAVQGAPSTPPEQQQASSTSVADYASNEASLRSWLGENRLNADLAEMYEANLKAWDEKAAACPTDQCRAAVQADRAASAAYALGQPGQVESLPFSGGLFIKTEEGFSGQLKILPMANDDALVVVELSFKERPSCFLKGVMSARPEGGWVVKSLEADLPDMVLTANGAEALSLAYTDASHEPWQADYCVVGVSIEGDYRRQ